ncbi:hypothetical protein ACQKLP_11300 [Chitinophaga sp. NPDC101104]|uniref:hypothetical protein n=1 Tax=Chitinophaga sp. NPDC101104 TaxID=3390561 RepID=UPI003D02F681
MKKFLYLKHWQLFALFIGVPVLYEVLIFSTAVSGNDPMHILYFIPVITLVLTGLYFSWFYALGLNLQEKLPAGEKMDLSRFKLFLLIPSVYILSISVFVTVAFFGDLPFSGPEFLVPGLLVPIHLFSMFCIFYCMYFIAKALKTVEWRRPVTFSDFAGEFFMIWFFPIGIWFLQPRINSIFADEQA